MLVLLLLFGDLLLELCLLLLSQLLKLGEVLDRSVLVVDDVFVGIDGFRSLLAGKRLDVDPVRIGLCGNVSLDFGVHLGNHAPDVHFTRWVVIVIVILLQASCALLHGG